jgi:hypothetical protein
LTGKIGHVIGFLRFVALLGRRRTKMFRHIYRLITGSSALVLAGSLANADQAVITVQDLHPFTHAVHVVAGADLSSIRFLGVKLVKVSTRISSATNTDSCRELAFRDPGGSLYCPRVQLEAPMPAYEVTYSYQGQPMTSDEHGSRYFTFTVYFRPEEFSPEARALLARGKAAGADVAAIFNLTTSRDLEKRVVIDEASSTFCEGTYVDGAWKQTNPQCKDDVKSKRVEALPEYVTIRVEPVPSRVAISAKTSRASGAARDLD